MGAALRPTVADTAFTPPPPVTTQRIYALVAAAVLLLTLLPVGTAVFWLGFVRGDSPCVMCWEQRIGMILVALVGLFVLRYGPKPRYVGMAVLIAMWGMFMGMRHTGMHAARDIGQGFSLEILGAHTYTWALFTYAMCVVAIALLLLVVRPSELQRGVRTLGRLDRATFWAFFVVVAANAVQAFASTGPPPFMGQSDPIRFSFNPRHWHWSIEEWKPTAAPVSLRGRFGVEKPDLSRLSAESDGGPLGALRGVVMKSRRHLDLPLDGAPTDLAYDAATGAFLVTTGLGVYLLDSTLTRVERHTIVDAGYSVDLGRFAGAAFLGEGKLLALGENKSYVLLRPSDTTTAEANFRYFLASPAAFDEVTRGRFGTVRARLLYVMSAAYDSATASIYTVTVPNHLVKRMVVSGFDRADLTLSEEWIPSLSPTSGLTLGKDRSLGEFMVTGATIANGRMYAVSAAYPALLTIDLASHEVIAAHALTGIQRPIGIASRGDDLYVLGEGGTLAVLSRPASAR